MKLERTYRRVQFSEEAIRQAAARFDATFGELRDLRARQKWLQIRKGDDDWKFDNEDEFFAAYQDANMAHYTRVLIGDGQSEALPWAEFQLYFFLNLTKVSVETRQDYLEAGQRNAVLAVMRVLDGHAEDCQLADDADSGPTVFIGHGRSAQWRDLKDHLADKHGFMVVAYETGARAGHAIRDTLQTMLEGSSFAVLVLTKEDETADGEVRARQNVVHETGLFQGKLGFERAIMLVEEGTEGFSNVQGIQQIRFKDIKETFGEVVATLRREFH